MTWSSVSPSGPQYDIYHLLLFCSYFFFMPPSLARVLQVLNLAQMISFGTLGFLQDLTECICGHVMLWHSSHVPIFHLDLCSTWQLFSVVAAVSATLGREGGLYIFFGRKEHFLHGVQNENKLPTAQKHGSYGILDEMSLSSLLAVVLLGVTVYNTIRLIFLWYLEFFSN